MPCPTPEQLRALLRYEPVTGKLFWRERGPEWFTGASTMSSEWRAARWNSRFAGTEAGSDNGEGYLVVCVLGWRLKAHRVAWAICFGVWPENEIDHIHGRHLGNGLMNIRDVPHSENGKNQTLKSNNASGICGVRWRESTKRWIAYITVKGRQISLGAFTEKDAAVAARRDAERKHDFHKNHGQRSAQA